MKTITKSIPDNAVCEPIGDSAIPDAINLDNIEVIRRGAMELNHRARLGMAIVTPFGMKNALESFGDDVARLCCRGGGLRVVNAAVSDPVAEQAALERQRQVEHKEKGKQIVKELSESLAAFAELLKEALAKRGAGTNNIPQQQVLQHMEKTPNVTPAMSDNKRVTRASKPAGKKSSAKRSA